MKTLDTTSGVIDALGGTAAVARLTGRTMQAVSNWRVRSNFPPDLHDLMISELRGKDATAPASLWNQVSRVGAAT